MKTMAKRRILKAALLAATALALSCAALDRTVQSPEMQDGKVVFRYLSPSARTVQVAGEWNNWSAGDAETGEVLVGLMERGDEGLWTIALELPPGRHRYWFVVNETGRVLDPANPRVTEDPWGGKASLCIVP
jgi:1,4-alpha-glucan branching enzyme